MYNKQAFQSMHIYITIFLSTSVLVLCTVAKSTLILDKIQMLALIQLQHQINPYYCVMIVKQALIIVTNHCVLKLYVFANAWT